MQAKIILLLLALPLLASAANDVIVSDLKIFVNNYEYIVKGISYSPAPLGISHDSGLCSVRQTPYGEYKSACYDSDFFDGNAQSDRFPPGPASGWFYDVWVRDFTEMKKTGINTLRVYNANPVTYQASVDNVGQYDITAPSGKDHTEFMQLAQTSGFKVIWPLLGDQTLIETLPIADLERLVKWQIDEVGNSPALLMYTVGNELPFANSTAGYNLVATVNTLIGVAREYQNTKWSRNIPFTSAVIDTPQYYDWLVEALDVDVFTANAGYRGVSFTDLWTGASTPGFSGFFNLSCSTSKPLLIGEMGWHQVSDAQNKASSTWFNQLYSDLVAHIDKGCIGGIFFEWSDEPQKTATDQRTMGVVRYTVTTNSDGTSSDDLDVWTPDTLVEKTDVNIWTSFVQGSYNGKMYNYNTDVFSLLGRPPAIYGSFSSSPCSGDPVITGATATISTMSTSATTGTLKPSATSTTATGSPRPATTGRVAGDSASLTISFFLVLAALFAATNLTW